MRHAIIGSGGFIAPRHFEAIKDVGGEVLLTCDIDPQKKADFLNYRDMLASPEFKNIDVVSICTPNYLHAEMVRDCLRTGKIVLCEKPLTINTDFTGLDGVNIVQQLRYHPLILEIGNALMKSSRISIVLKAFRDEDFWRSWKGDEAKSGGAIYILGAHIFDIIVKYLGGSYKILYSNDTMKLSRGIIAFGNKLVDFHVQLLDDRNGQTRHLEIDGVKYQLSIKDNLSFEGLHDKVYSALLSGTAPGLKDVKDSIVLIDSIKKSST